MNYIKNKLFGLCFTTYNKTITKYNNLKYMFFYVQTIQMDDNNIYIYYLMIKMLAYCKHKEIPFTESLLNNINDYIGEGLIDMLYETPNRKCKMIMESSILDIIKRINHNAHKIIKQSNMPKKYIINSCHIINENNTNSDIKHLLYLYYDPYNIFDNTICNILIVNKIDHNIQKDKIRFNLFHKRPYVITYNLHEILYKKTDILNNII